MHEESPADALHPIAARWRKRAATDDPFRVNLEESTRDGGRGPTHSHKLSLSRRLSKAVTDVTNDKKEELQTAG